MPGAHAILGASSSHRWLLCTPSARIEASLPDTSSTAAQEGTLAHEMAELKLRKYFTLEISPKAFTTRLNKLKKHELYQEEMLEHTETYLDYIKECAMHYLAKPTVDIEVRLDFSELVPDGFGTGDCIIVGGDTLHIIDFKYGKGVQVEASNNSQMMLYAIGALNRYGFIYPIKTIKLTIFQPRRDHISEWEISVDELNKWAEGFVRPRAKLAYEGAGDFCPGEEQCRFCRAKGRCKALRDYNLQIMEIHDTEPGMMTYSEIATVLSRADLFLKWIDAVREYALTAALAGDEIPGFKVVAGTSRRVFTDQDAAFAALQEAGYNEAVLYERKPITLAGAEKLAGKKAFEEICGAYIDKPYGAPTLVPENDRREPYIKAAADFAGLTDNTVKGD